MATAAAETLQREVDAAIEEAARQRGGLRRRAAAACDRIRRRHALARAEVLAPSFRADLLRRGRGIQKNRAHLMQTLKRFAAVLPSGDVWEECGHPNVVVVLRAVQEAFEAEEELAHWRQPLPCEEAWHEACAAVGDGGRRADVPPQPPGGSELRQRQQQERLEAALEHLLVPSCAKMGAEEDEAAAAAAAAPLGSWISLPCFCTMAHFCRYDQLPVVVAAAAAAARGGGGGSSMTAGVREGGDEALHDAEAEAERGDGRVAQVALDAAAAHLGRLGGRAGEGTDGSNQAGDAGEEEATESALEEVRLRVSLEVAARVTACRYAAESLAAGADGILLDGVTTVTAAAPLAVPVTVLVLPPMEQLFFCVAYTIGAAILRDEQRERRAAADAATAADDDGGGDGWRGALERWMRREGPVGTAGGGTPVGPRLLQYLLDYVFSPAECDSQRKGAAALVQPRTARRWLELALGNTPEKEGAIDAMMARYLKRQ
ncbi:uncharacterized protein Tco025E_01604 [Trypanosoma conorhini]|uniref:Uncharacterized protein n=1 Tax=Trypanosoma conorhini TaxID=83891 RepID=A0A422Q835_9TRYP|nr:uncharacterized protein Tco025E_01604 [Trypanosoma conorhini]RNF26121.1 hypothetical protein Tco025E_01604 [Trypanosoma conorhini]